MSWFTFLLLLCCWLVNRKTIWPIKCPAPKSFCLEDLQGDLVVVVVVMTSPSGTAYMGGQMSRRDEEIHQTLDPEGSVSFVIVDSHFIDWGTTKGRLSLPTADVLSTVVK